MSTGLRAENERIAAMVNVAWGEKVAWVEDRTFIRVKGSITLPVVVSKLVNGRLPGRATYPAFFAGPAPSFRR
jgi:hypothetical protein